MVFRNIRFQVWIDDILPSFVIALRFRAWGVGFRGSSQVQDLPPAGGVARD